MPIRLDPLEDYLPKTTGSTNRIMTGMAEQQAAQVAAQTAQQNQQLTMLKVQEAQQKAQEEQVLQAEIAAYMKAPSVGGAHRLVTLNPDPERIKLLESMKAEERQTLIDTSRPVYNALLEDRPDIALREGAVGVAALRIAGRGKDADALQVNLAKIEENPSLAVLNFGSILAPLMGKEAFEAAYKNTAAVRREDKAKAARAEAALAADIDPRGGLLAKGRQDVATSATQSEQNQAAAANSRNLILDRNLQRPGQMALTAEQTLEAGSRTDERDAKLEPELIKRRAEAAREQALLDAMPATAAREERQLKVNELRAKIDKDEEARKANKILP